MHSQAASGPQKTEKLSAAGGVVLRRVDGRTEAVLCGRTSAGLWALPKGKPTGSEPPVETARREVHEETGLDVEVGRLVGEIRYSFIRPEDGALCDKVVRFFLMRPIGGDILDHDGEFDEVAWLPAGDAAARLTHENEARILEKAVALAEGTAAV